MSALPTVLTAAQRLAETARGGPAKLLQHIREKVILPQIVALRDLPAAGAAFEAIGAEEFRIALINAKESQLQTLLKRLDKHGADPAGANPVELHQRLEALASGAAQPTEPAPKQPPSERTATKRRQPKQAPTPAPVPDLRALYRESGTKGVVAALKPLTNPQLKAAIDDQGIQCSAVRPGTKKEQRLKFIQEGLKEELGPRADPIAAMQKLKAAEAKN